MSRGRTGSPLAIAVVYPDLLGTYGDGGNGLVLARRASWRGIDAELIQAHSGRPLPSADIYCIGGGEDGPEVRAAEALRAGRHAWTGPSSDGAVVLGVCAGYQLLGRSFPDSADRPHDGLGLLDVTTRKGTGPRAVGEVVATPSGRRPPAGRRAAACPTLTGFENHSAVTAVGPGARPVAGVVRGVGNGGGDRTEGAWSGRVLGTYLHGPVLARNTGAGRPAAGLGPVDLGWAEPPLDPLDDAEELALRDERLAAVEASASDRFFRRLTGHRPEPVAADLQRRLRVPAQGGGSARRASATRRPSSVSPSAGGRGTASTNAATAAASGPWSGGWRPAAACLRAVHQSEPASLAMVATAASMRTPNRRAFSPSSGRRGVPKVMVVRVRRMPLPPLGRMCRVPSRCTGTTGQPVRTAR